MDQHYRQVFIIQTGEGGGVEVYSNRQLIMRWIDEHGYVGIEKKGKPMKQLSHYRQLCRELEGNRSIPLLVIETGKEPTRYNLFKAPIISK